MRESIIGERSVPEEKKLQNGPSEKQMGRKERRRSNREWKRKLREIRREVKREQKGSSKRRTKPEKKQEKKTNREEPENFHDLLFTRASLELPIREIKDGIIHTTDGRFVKIIEVLPINFLHRSSSEQRNIIYSFMGYLKIAPPELQIKSV